MKTHIHTRSRLYRTSISRCNHDSHGHTYIYRVVTLWCCVMTPLLITRAKRVLLVTPCIPAGLILAYGIIVLIGGTNDLAGAAFGVDTADDIGGSDGVFPPIVWLLAQLTVTTFGLVSVFLGFQVCLGVCVCVLMRSRIEIRRGNNRLTMHTALFADHETKPSAYRQFSGPFAATKIKINRRKPRARPGRQPREGFCKFLIAFAGGHA